MLSALERIGLRLLNLCIWSKTNGGMGSLYRSKHELCRIAKKGCAAHTNNVELGKNGRYPIKDSKGCNERDFGDQAATPAEARRSASSRTTGMIQRP